MTEIPQSRLYMNLFARAISIVNLFPSCYSEIYALKDFQTKFDATNNELYKLDIKDANVFLTSLEQIISTVETHDTYTKVIQAVAICLFLDRKLSYLADTNDAFSIDDLVPLSNNKAVILNTPLNSNFKETGICINPKFSACLLYERTSAKQKGRRVFNRDSLVGLNGELKHCSFARWDETFSVTNIIISGQFLSEHCTHRLRVGFSPLSDTPDLLDTGVVAINRNNIDYSGEELKKINAPELIGNRFCNAWQLASANDADIFFAPEMLCTKEMLDAEDDYNLLIHKMAMERLLEGKTIPSVTILPSYWHNGTNSCQMTYQDGKILGEQIKRFPYVDRANGTLEAINFQNSTNIVLLHIPGVHRIAVMICADFLTQQEDWLEKYICGQLQATLIIVPSYSGGEQDFINSLPILKRYGTSVIWGNCCGAKSKGKKQIGGCGVVGTDSIARFGDVCVCQTSCQATAGCAFIIDMPLKLTGDRESDSVVVTHHTKTDKV